MVNFERIIHLLPQRAGKNQICNALTDVDVASRFRDKTFNSLLFFVIQIRNRTTLLLRIWRVHIDNKTATASTTRTRENVLRRPYFISPSVSPSRFLHLSYSPFSPSKYLKTQAWSTLNTQTHTHTNKRSHIHTIYSNIVIYSQTLDRTQMIRFII